MKLKYDTYISQDEMLLAKTDDQALLNILRKVDRYVHYIVEIMYHQYGAHKDAAISKDDLYCYCQSNIISAIRLYYHPERYDPKKDKRDIYKNGFTFIVNITYKHLNRIWKRQNRKRRIPLDLVTSFDMPLGNDGDDLRVIDQIAWKEEIRSDYLISILEYFKKNNSKIEKTHVYDVVKEILTNHLSCKDLAVKFKVKRKVMKKLILDNIVLPFTPNGKRIIKGLIND